MEAHDLIPSDECQAFPYLECFRSEPLTTKLIIIRRQNLTAFNLPLGLPLGKLVETSKPLTTEAGNGVAAGSTSFHFTQMCR
jgi:hypothetical protein